MSRVSEATHDARAVGVGSGARPARLARAIEVSSTGDTAIDQAADIGNGDERSPLFVAEYAGRNFAERDRLRAAIESGPKHACWLILSQNGAEVDANRFAPRVEIRSAELDDESLVQIGRSLIQEMDLASENRFLRDTIRIMEDCRSLAHCLEPTELYPMCIDLLLRAIHRERGLAVFRRGQGAQNDAFALRGFNDQEASALSRVLLAGGRIDLDAFEGISVAHQGAFHDAFSEAGISAESLLLVSFGGEGRASGVVAVLGDPSGYRAGDIERADIVARHGISALANAGTYATAKDRAFVDDVTSAYNARYLLETVENEIQRADRYGDPLSVLFLDLDRFKKVNDSHGHLVGSETLRSLCRLLERCVRNVDTLARYGGDEFSIVLVDTDHDTALQVADRIRQTVAEHTFRVGSDISLSLTVSIGVSSCPEHGMDRDLLLDAADRAMYRAKAAGRNRIESAGDSG
ncbi:GGDEF domain-containing protein [Myxococcota bacterium]|nr:GGDEF domain-containing protein [Myxococcota bacterium]